VKANLFGGDENGLGQEDDDPAGKCDTVNDPEGGELELRAEGVEKKGVRDAGKYQRGGENSDEEVEAAVA